MRRRILLIVFGMAILALLTPFVPQGESRPESVAAQGNTTSNIVLAAFSNYIGINPPLTAEELEFTEVEDRRFSVSFTFTGLDLSNGGLSCSSRVMDPDERIVGAPIGWRYIITINGRRYELRSDFNGTRIIRCFNGSPIDFDYSYRGIGSALDGEGAVRRAMAHLSTYLDLPISIEAANDPQDGDPRVFYRWTAPIVYNDASLGCPLAGATYDVRDTIGWRVTLTVNGRVYPYRVRLDGGVVVLCFGGRPDPTSIGLPTVSQ